VAGLNRYFLFIIKQKHHVSVFWIPLHVVLMLFDLSML
jgi:hypothetical protein